MTNGELIFVVLAIHASISIGFLMGLAAGKKAGYTIRHENGRDHAKRFYEGRQSWGHVLMNIDTFEYKLRALIWIGAIVAVVGIIATGLAFYYGWPR